MLAGPCLVPLISATEGLLSLEAPDILELATDFWDCVSIMFYAAICAALLEAVVPGRCEPRDF